MELTDGKAEYAELLEEWRCNLNLNKNLSEMTDRCLAATDPRTIMARLLETLCRIKLML